MADPTDRSDTGSAHDRESPPGIPRWVKLFAAIAVAAVIMLAVMLLAGGDHGPGRHTSEDQGGPPPATQPAVAGGHRLAAGHTR